MSYSGELMTPILEKPIMIWETSSKERQGMLLVVTEKGASLNPRLAPRHSQSLKGKSEIVQKLQCLFFGRKI